MKTNVLLVLVLFAGCASLGMAQKDTPRLSLSIQADQASYEIGQTIRLKVTVTNITTHDILVPARDPYMYRIVAADANGKAVAEIPPRSDEVRIGSGLLATLKPKESLTDDVNASVALDFSKPGKYFVRVLSAADSDAGKPVASNVVNITVTSSPPK